MARVYFRIVDREDGESAAVKMISDPPRDEWDPDNLTPAQTMALLAMGAMMDGGEIQEVATEDGPETITVRSFDIGNN